MTWLRETRALSVVVFRYWARAGLPNRLRKDQGRRASAGLFRAAALALMANWGYTTGHKVALAPAEDRAAAIAWLVVGLVGFAWSWGMLGRVPSMRGVVSPMQSPLLDALPLGETSRVVVGLFERLLAYGIGVVAVACAASPGRGALVGFLAVTLGLLAGDATMRFFRVVVSPTRVARAGILMVVLQVPSMLIFVSAPMLGSQPRAKALVSALAPLGDAALGGGAFAAWTAASLVAIALAAGAIRLAERVGYDRVDVVPQDRLAAAAYGDLGVDGVERVLVKREPGGKWGVRLMTGYVAIFSIGATVSVWLVARRGHVDDTLLSFVRVCAALTALMPFSLAMGRATRMVQRDVVARPLLAALPIAPSDLLRGKARAIVGHALIVASPFLVLFLVPLSTGWHLELAWRGATIAGALVASSIALVAVAFLTEGVGTLRIFGGAVTIETTLVMAPLLAVATAPNLWSAAVSLGCLAFLAFEGRRTALRAVRWIDDPDDFERETPPWRAVLVLASFQAAQAFVLRGLALSGLDEGARIGIAYAASAAVLVALTAYGRRGMPAMRVMPARPAWLLAGLALGGASGGAALLYLGALRRSGVALPSAPESPSVALAFAIVAVVLAPPAEEVFFRGWLQGAIAGELSRRWLAPVLAALAFAFVHPPLSFPAIVLLGLATGLLYARTGSIAPCIAAHATHNTIAVLFAS